MDNKTFSAICYLVLMTTGGSKIEDKHPSYIMEKLHMLDDAGYDAFSHLDLHNMRRVVDYMMTWKYPIPPQVLERYNAEEQAHKELSDMGIDL